MLCTCPFRQLSRCLTGRNHAIGQYPSALSRAAFDGHLEFVWVHASARRHCANRGAWELRRPTGNEGPLPCGRNETSSKWNPEAGRIMDYGAKEIVGQHLSHFLST
jgi:hypothetical protein